MLVHQSMALGYSEELEREADAGGVDLARRAGFDGAAAATALEKLLVEELEVSAPPERSGAAGLVVRSLQALQGHFATHPTRPGADRLRDRAGVAAP